MRCNRKTACFAVTPLRKKSFTLIITKILQLRRNQTLFTVLRHKADNSEKYSRRKFLNLIHQIFVLKATFLSFSTNVVLSFR